MCTTFPFAETLSNGKAGFEGFRTAICTGEIFYIKCDFSSSTVNLLIFLSGCAAYGLLFKQTRALRSNSVFKAIALLAKPAKICQRSACGRGEICTLIPEGNGSVQIGCSTLLAAPFVERCTRQKKRAYKYTSNLYRLQKCRSFPHDRYSSERDTTA